MNFQKWELFSGSPGTLLAKFLCDRVYFLGIFYAIGCIEIFAHTRHFPSEVSPLGSGRRKAVSCIIHLSLVSFRYCLQKHMRVQFISCLWLRWKNLCEFMSTGVWKMQKWWKADSSTPSKMQ